MIEVKPVGYLALEVVVQWEQTYVSANPNRLVEAFPLQARLHRIFFRPQPEAQERMLKEEDQEDVDQCDAT